MFFGIFTFALVLFVWLTGITAAIIGRFKLDFKLWGNHNEIHNRLFAIHKYFARINVLAGYIAATTGLIAY